jgi:hypothetical protein
MVYQISELKFIRLRRTTLTDVSIHAITTTYTSSLLKLDLCLCDQMTSSALINIYENCPNIEKLYLSWIYSCTDADVKNILFKCTSLKALKLEGCKNITSEVRLWRNFS